jgi:hypothetical protein
MTRCNDDKFSILRNAAVLIKSMLCGARIKHNMVIYFFFVFAVIYSSQGFAMGDAQEFSFEKYAKYSDKEAAEKLQKYISDRFPRGSHGDDVISFLEGAGAKCRSSDKHVEYKFCTYSHDLSNNNFVKVEWKIRIYQDGVGDFEKIMASRGITGL